MSKPHRVRVTIEVETDGSDEPQRTADDFMSFLSSYDFMFPWVTAFEKSTGRRVNK